MLSSRNYNGRDYVDDLVLLTNTPALNKSLLYKLRQEDGGIGHYVSANKIEYLSFKREEAISTLSGGLLKLMNKFTYLGSSVSSTESGANKCAVKAWTARLLIMWKSNLYDKIKWDFFQAVSVSVLLDGCTTFALIKRMEKKLDGNYARMLRAILNES